MDDHWDTGEQGCGQLIFQLHTRLNKMKAGQVLEVIVRDKGAPTDLPAWCRMTGHELISANHPTYQIRRKND